MPRKPPECAGCPLYERGEGFAWGDGDPTSDVWLIAEALGEHEAREGVPMVGGSGRYLNRMLQKAGSARAKHYITNILRCRPPDNIIQPWLPKAADHCAQYLERDLSIHRPRVIVAIGGVALDRLTGYKDGIYAGRGYVFQDAPLPGVRTIGTLHPAELVRAANVREKKQARHRESHESVVVADLKKAIRESETPPFQPNILIAKSPDDFRAWITAQVRDHVAVDIETYGGNVMICVGFGTITSGICVPLVNEQGERAFSEADERELVRLMSDLFTNPTIVKVFHNGYSFDVVELRKRGFVIVNWEDTMILHHTKYSELPHKLRFLGSIYTRMPPWKHEGKEDEKESGLDK